MLRVDYSQPLALQIETFVLPIINRVGDEMSAFLVIGLNLRKENLSPFAQKYESMSNLASVFASSDTKKELTELGHYFAESRTNIANDEDEDNEEEEIDLDALDSVVSFTLNNGFEDSTASFEETLKNKMNADRCLDLGIHSTQYPVKS